MTTIVYNKGIIASDSRVTLSGELVYSEKIQKLQTFCFDVAGERHEFLMALAGHAAASSWFQAWFMSGGYHLFPPFFGMVDAEQYNSLAQAWSDHAPPAFSEITVWLAHQGKLYEIYEGSASFITVEIDEGRVLGSGTCAAMGALALKPNSSAADIVRACAKVDTATGGEFIDTCDIRRKRLEIKRLPMNPEG